MEDLKIPDIKGQWAGHNQQLRHGLPMVTKIFCEFEQSESQVSGTITFLPAPDQWEIYPYADKLNLVSHITGEWVNGKVLSIKWKTDNEDLLFCGSFCLELMHNGDKLAGKFIGFGLQSHAIVSGDTVLVRKNDA